MLLDDYRTISNQLYWFYEYSTEVAFRKTASFSCNSLICENLLPDNSKNPYKTKALGGGITSIANYPVTETAASFPGPGKNLKVSPV